MPESGSSSSSSPSVNDTGEEIYEVGGIVSHMKAADLINRIFDGEALCYYPDSISNNESFHSEYAYLVHWNNFESFEDTWEPEGSLKHLQLLHDYKESVNLEKKECPSFFFHCYSKEDTDRLRWRSIKHQEEIMRIKRKLFEAKEEEKKHRMKQKMYQSEDPHRLSNAETSDSGESSPPAPSTSEIFSEPPRKKKKKKERRENKHVEENVQPTLFATQLMKFKIPKKSDVIAPEKDAKVKNVEETKENIEVPMEIDAGLNIVNASSSSQNQPENRKHQTESLKSVEVKKSIKKPKPVVVKPPKMKIVVKEAMPHRSFSTALELLQTRKWRSLENLNSRWEDASEVELFNRKHFLLNTLNGKEEVPVEKTLLSEFDQIKLEIEAQKAKREAILLARNIEAVRKDFENHIKGGNAQEMINELVRCYTLDYFDDFEDVFSSIPKSNEALRFAVIQSIIRRCKTSSTYQSERKWIKRNKKSKKGFDLRFVETDLDVDFQQLPVAYEKCSENHSKCIWLDIFLKLTPMCYRFIVETETSKEDGPFRDDVFLHCLKYGADCQKWMWLKHDAPFGFLEDDQNDKIIDHVHIVVTQGMNLLKIQEYIRQGFDVNVFAKVGKKGKLQALWDYVREWADDMSKTAQGKNLDLNYFRHLEDMLNNISNCVFDFMMEDTYKTLIYRSDGLIRPKTAITPPHVLHCSPVNNVENGGGGENQVLTCLFQPLGCLLADGLREKGRRASEEECQLEMDRMRKLTKEGKGRMILVVLSVKINTYLPNEKMKMPPIVKFKVVEDDDGFEIDRMTLLRQGENLIADEADIGMVEMRQLASPGRRYFCLHNLRHETELVVPGMAHIEMKGRVDKATNFLVQLFFVQTAKDSE